MTLRAMVVRREGTTGKASSEPDASEPERTGCEQWRLRHGFGHCPDLQILSSIRSTCERPWQLSRTPMRTDCHEMSYGRTGVNRQKTTDPPWPPRDPSEFIRFPSETFT